MNIGLLISKRLILFLASQKTTEKLLLLFSYLDFQEKDHINFKTVQIYASLWP